MLELDHPRATRHKWLMSNHSCYALPDSKHGDLVQTARCEVEGAQNASGAQIDWASKRPADFPVNRWDNAPIPTRRPNL